MESNTILALALFIFSALLGIIGYLVKRSINGLQYYLDDIRDKLEEISLTLSKTITEQKLHKNEIEHMKGNCLNNHTYINNKFERIDRDIDTLKEFKIKQENK